MVIETPLVSLSISLSSFLCVFEKIQRDADSVSYWSDSRQGPPFMPATSPSPLTQGVTAYVVPSQSWSAAGMHGRARVCPVPDFPLPCRPARFYFAAHLPAYLPACL